MVKSYMELIGIFRGKQAKHNLQILNILYDNGPLTAWEITGKITNVGKVSLHATLNKRLRSLEKKGYLAKAGKKWCLRFKGIIATITSHKTPRPISNKWADLTDSFSKNVEEHQSALQEMTVQIDGVAFNPFQAIKRTGHAIRTFNDWVTLSNFVKGLIQTGVINFDVISNETLITIILSEVTRTASKEQLGEFMRNWKFKISPSGAKK